MAKDANHNLEQFAPQGFKSALADAIMAFEYVPRVIGEVRRMAAQSHSVTTWIGKLKAGDPEAAQPIWERYFAGLVQIARDRLCGVSRAASDEEDVALSAFHSFCQAVAHRRFPDLNNREELLRLLVMHTIRKAIDQRRYSQRLKRGGLEQPTDDELIEEVVGEAPDPQLAAVLAEEFSRLLDLLGAVELQHVAVAKLEGYTNAEIAQRLDCSERSVYRRLTIIRGIWHAANSESGGANLL